MIDAVRAYRRRSAQRDDRGFTLIELMVVVLIIAILLLIALPKFLGAQQGAQRKGAQASVRTALVAVKAYAAENGNFKDFEAATAKDIKLVDGTGGATISGANEVLFQVAPDGNTVTLVARSDDGKCFAAEESVKDPTKYGVADDAGSNKCAINTVGTITETDQKVGWKVS